MFLLELNPPPPSFNQDYLARDSSFYVPPNSYIERKKKDASKLLDGVQITAVNVKVFDH